MLIPPPIVEVAWPIRFGGCAPHHGYALFAALCRVGLLHHGQPDTILMPPNRKLVIRCPEAEAHRLAGAGLADLDVLGRRLVLGAPEVRPIRPAEVLEAWCVTIKGCLCDGSLRASAQAQLDRQGVAGRLQIGPRRVLFVAGKAVIGYGVHLDRLSEADSLTVQARGVGGKTRMGCGAFVPC